MGIIVVGKTARVGLTYRLPISIPAEYKHLFWDEPKEALNLEKPCLHPFSFQRLSLKMRERFPVRRQVMFTDNVDFWVGNGEDPGIKMASGYDLFLDKLYSAGWRVEGKDAVEYAFLFHKYQWDRAQVKLDFERKFPDESFEIYLGAMLSTEDHPGLGEETRLILERLKEEWCR